MTVKHIPIDSGDLCYLASISPLKHAYFQDSGWGKLNVCELDHFCTVPDRPVVQSLVLCSDTPYYAMITVCMDYPNKDMCCIAIIKCSIDQGMQETDTQEKLSVQFTLILYNYNKLYSYQIVLFSTS